MKEEFGKWLFDIAKYVMTGVILASLFSNVKEQWILLISALCLVAITLASGAWLMRKETSKTAKKKIK
ncbi:MAG: hypothetical protein LBK12_07810 [Odoribacteraceae bacterium]|jgi:hypothetical protein|nr:hypothetical protein [Odoribacteraceae bacterium]